jgi:4,5-dihydroxyphthalate decarboxylase
MTLPLSCACPPSDRVQALMTGQVVPAGIQLHFSSLPVEEIFWRQVRHAEFDVSECSLSSYVMLRAKGDERFIAIPAFTSRCFRHASVFVNTRKGIQNPGDLRGKTVGVPEYQITASVWLRGIFEDEYGVHAKEINWCRGGEEMPGRVEKSAIQLPSDICLQDIPNDRTLSQMLDDGEIDALFTAREPSCFTRRSPNVARLFPDHRGTEEAYFKKTGIFPIMHTMVIKQAVYRQNPWVAVNLYQAFCRAKEVALKTYNETAALGVTLPWVISEVERTREIMGHDWWPYGVSANQKTLATFLRYHHDQGLSNRLMSLENLFAPETMDEEFKI